ncbi:MAG TPA: hypothetical protein VGL02_27020 [Streptomyces sp.]
MAVRADLETAARAIPGTAGWNSEIAELLPFGIAVLPFKDPDGVARKLTARCSRADPGRLPDRAVPPWRRNN